MKPSNFPGRKNDRRKRALAHIMTPPPDSEWAKDASKHPYVVTHRCIIANDVARGIRTKKDRSANAKFRA